MRVAKSVLVLVVVILGLTACSDGDEMAQNAANGSGTGDSLSDDEMMAEPAVGSEAPTIDAPATERSRSAGADGYIEMDWDELLPADFSFDPYIEQMDLENYNINELEDRDPEAQRLYEELKALLADVPSEPALQGVKGRLPGFAVPIDFDGSRVYSFLLVPYYGACIHTPPPPANQMVYVEIADGFELPSLYEPVIIEGEFDVATVVEEGLGTAGYSMNADAVTLY